MACRISVPQPGIEPMPPAVEVWSLNHWTAREVPLLCLVLSPSVFGLSQGPPMCVRASLSQDGLQHRGLWVGWHHLLWGGAPSLLTPEEPSCVVRKVFLTPRMRNMWSLYLFSGQGSAPLCSRYYLCLGVSAHRGQTPAAQPGPHLSPASRSFKFSPMELNVFNLLSSYIGIILNLVHRQILSIVPTLQLHAQGQRTCELVH